MNIGDLSHGLESNVQRDRIGGFRKEALEQKRIHNVSQETDPHSLLGTHQVPSLVSQLEFILIDCHFMQESWKNTS